MNRRQFLKRSALAVAAQSVAGRALAKVAEAKGKAVPLPQL